MAGWEKKNSHSSYQQFMIKLKELISWGSPGVSPGSGNICNILICGLSNGIGNTHINYAGNKGRIQAL